MNEKLCLLRRANLEAEKATLLDELKVARTTINELRSMKAFDDQQLKNTVAALKAEESRRKTEVDDVRGKIRDMKEENEEMAFRMTEMEGELEELTAENTATKNVLEGLMREMQVLQEESSRTITQVCLLNLPSYAITRNCMTT